MTTVTRRTCSNSSDIRREVAIFDRYFRQIEQEFAGVRDKLKFNEALKRMLNHLVTDLLENTRRRLQASGVETLDDIRRHPERLAAFSPAADEERAQAKSSSSLRTSTTANRCARRRPTEKRLSTTFSAIGLSTPPACRPATSARWRREPRARVICDYIAGMTDNYILDQHRKLAERSVSK